MKKLAPLITLAIIVPQVTFAAWWNPFSWFDKWSFIRDDREKDALEERVKELEEKLGETEPASNTEEVIENDKQESVSAPSIPKSVNITTAPQSSQVQPPSSSVKKLLSIDELIDKYTYFRDLVTSDKSGLDQFSNLYTERKQYAYLANLLDLINADLGYLWTIKSWTQKPANIESVYTSKFNNLQTSYNSEVATYVVEREQNIKSLEIANKIAEEEAIKQAIEDKAQLIRDIKVKRAEMNQLATQIDTLAGSSLIPILNLARKIDGTNLFYTFDYSCGSYSPKCEFAYPYKDDGRIDSTSYLGIRSGLKAIVSNYNAFLFVELAKYE